MRDDIPPLRRPQDLGPIESQTDLELLWRELIGELGFSARSLWVLLLSADGCPGGVVPKVEDLPNLPDEQLLGNLMALCGDLIDADLAGGRVAFLYSRPGPRQVTDQDLAWARGLLSAGRRVGVPCEPVHLANDEELRVFSPDDLVADSAG